MVEVHKRDDIQHPCAKGAPASLRDYMGHQVGNCSKSYLLKGCNNIIIHEKKIYFLQGEDIQLGGPGEGGGEGAPGLALRAPEQIAFLDR